MFGAAEHFLPRVAWYTMFGMFDMEHICYMLRLHDALSLEVIRSRRSWATALVLGLLQLVFK